MSESKAATLSYSSSAQFSKLQMRSWHEIKKFGRGKSHSSLASSRKRLVKSFIRCCCCCCPQSLTVSVSDANTRGARRKRQKREWVREWRKKRPYGRRVLVVETDVQWNGGSPPSTRDSPWGIAQLGWQVCVIIVIAWLLLHTAYATFFW